MDSSAETDYGTYEQYNAESSDDSMENIFPDLSLVLFGNSSSVQFGHENLLLGEKQTNMENAGISRNVPLKRKISEYHVSVINMIDLCETEPVDNLIGQLVNEKEILAYIFVMQLGQLTNDDKMSLEWLQRLFGEKDLHFVMILFTYERKEETDTINDLKKNPVLEKLLEKCGGRYQTCNKMMNNQLEMRELMKKIWCLKNKKELENSERKNSTSEVKPNEVLNLILLGEKGAGKSASGNTILGQEAFISKKSSKLVTQDVAVKSGTVNGFPVTVYDTPGFSDPKMGKEEIQQMINEKALQKCESGSCAFLLVIKADSFNEQELRTVEKIEKLLGEIHQKKTWIIFTRGDDLENENMTIDEFINDSEQLKTLVEKYERRFHVFNNKKGGSSDQARILLDNILQGSLELKVEKAQKKIDHDRPCQSAVNNNQNMSRENTSSKTVRKDHSNGKGLRVAHDIKNNWSRKIKGGSNENLHLFKLNLDETWQNSDGFCRRSTFGKNMTNENKIIMMIGATGAGKTTLINSMINYILGVEWKDDFRFVLIDEGKQKSQAVSQTSEITAYQINHMDGFRVQYSLTIVDTPGFGDTRGIAHDQKITAQIQEFFSAHGGIDCIDAVCFVVQASLARLTHTQKYVFDSILSIFGNDIAQNILVLVTFADGKAPPVLEAIKVADVPCSTTESGDPLHFKFNNSALFAANNTSADDEESDCQNFDEMFWKLGFSSMKKFFTSLITMKTQSLFLTQEVLKERRQLEVHVQGLQPQINAGLTKLDEIKKTKAALDQHKAEMDANKDFEYEFEVTVPKLFENKTSKYLTNCQKCNYTCHDACAYGDDRDKHMCMAMRDGKCRICPGKCVWNVHYNQKYKWVYVPEKRKGTYKELKERFEDAHGQVMSKEKIFEELEKEFQVVQDIVTELIKGSQKSLERLQEIALKPNPLSTPDYIDLLIESEKQEAKPGFQDRVRSLMKVREKAEIISKVSTGKVLPDDWKDYKQETRSCTESSYNPVVIFTNVMKKYFRKK